MALVVGAIGLVASMAAIGWSSVLMLGITTLKGRAVFTAIRDMRQRWLVLEYVEGGGHLVVHCGSLRSCERFYDIDGRHNTVIVRRSTFVKSLQRQAL